MSRIPVYSNVELVGRLQRAYSEVKNCTRLCIKLRQDETFRQKHGLDQASIDKIFENAGIKAPQIQHVSVSTLKTALDDAKSTMVVPAGGVGYKEKPVSKNPPLREHQEAAMAKLKKVIASNVRRGKFILPTGTGKTRIEAETIKHLDSLNDTPGIYVVLAPRILLTYQLLDAIGKIVAADGMKADFLNVNSGEFDTERLEKSLSKIGINIREVASTTSVEEIGNKILRAKAENKTLLIFSTYHSVGRVNEAVQQTNSVVDAYIYDEAQYCVTNGDFKEVPNFDSNYKFFFTATEKYTDDPLFGVGMNNESIFGKVLYTEKPKTLIGRGEMVSVAIHLVGSREHIDEDNYESKARVVTEAFEKHREILKQYAANPDAIGPKMLVVCDKQDSLKGMMRSKALMDYKRNNPSVKLYALSSDFGIHIEGYGHSSKVTNKEKEYLFAQLNDLENTDEAIIFHVDMMAEGIDVPGITGIMPFRNLSKIKFLQNLGRGTRLVGIDRERLYAAEIMPKEWGKYIKPYCWVILPVLSHDSYDSKRRFTDYVRSLRSDYEFDTSELIVIDNVRGPNEEKVQPDITGFYDHKFRLGNDIIKEIIQEIEDDEAMSEFLDQAFEFKKLSETEQLQLIKDIYTTAVV